MQFLLAFRADVLGSISQVEVLRIVIPAVGSKTFSPLGDAELWVLCWFYVTAWEEVNGEIVSHLPILMLRGLVHLMCMSCSVSFQISFEGNWSACSYRSSVSVRGGFRILLCCHFEAEKHFSVSYKKCCITNTLVGIGNDIMWEKMNISDWIEKWFRMLDSMRSFKNTLTDLFSSYFSLNVCTRTRYNDPCLVKYKGLFY